MNLIYAIVNPLNERYIGATTSWARRRNKHRQHLRRGIGINRLLQTSCDLHGVDSHVFTAVASVLRREDLHLVERDVMRALSCELNVNMRPDPIGEPHARKPKGLDNRMKTVFVEAGGHRRTYKQWSAITGVLPNTMKQRAHAGWGPEEIVGLHERPPQWNAKGNSKAAQKISCPVFAAVVKSLTLDPLAQTN